MSGLSARVDEHLSKGIPLGEAISKASAEQSSHVDYYDRVSAEAREGRNASFHGAVDRSKNGR